MRPKTTRESYVTLPIELRNDMQQLPLTKTQLSHCYKFVGILYRDSIADHWDATIPTAKPWKYLTKAFDDKYYIWLYVLLDNNIVIRFGTPSKVIHKSYDYVVNPKYVSNLSSTIQSHLVNQESNPINVLCKEIYWESLCTVTYKDIIKNETQENYTYRKWFTDDINTLKIQYDLLYEIAIKRIDDLCIDEFIVDTEILPPSIKVNYNNGIGLFQNTQKVLSNIADGDCLVKDTNVYKVVNPVQFISDKKATMKIYYKNSIDRLRNNNLDAKRNSTNSRLDSNLTNMASILVDAVCLQNDLIQIDLSNSQFVLLTNLLKSHLNTVDYGLFKELSVSGNLYSYIASNLSLKNAKNGKSLMFEVMFSSRRNNSIFKKKIKEMFPSVVGWIDNYKNEHGDKKFSVMLQKIESDLFIETILKRVKKHKYFCITKHDSLIVKRQEYEAVMDILKEEFAKIGLEYSLKVTNLYGNNIVNKIGWDEISGADKIHNPIEEESEVFDVNADIKDYTIVDVKNFGYSNIPISTKNGQTLYVPKLYLKYWDKIKTQLGSMKKLQNEYTQTDVDIVLKRIIEDILINESVHCKAMHQSNNQQ